MRVAIFGADGQLGTALQEVLGDRAIPFSHKGLDVTGAGLLMEVALEVYNPDWIINCAAVHKVDELEIRPTQALAVNAVGAYNVALAARNIDAGVVYISTDYVFGHGGPWGEYESTQPLNVYGISKSAGEGFTQAYAPRWLVIRTSTLFGGVSSKGASFVDTMLRLGHERDSLEVVSDLRISPTYVKDLAEKIVEILKMGYYNGIVHITNKGSCSFKEFAEEIFRQAGLDVEVQPCKSSDRDIAVRPGNSVLYHDTLSRWQADDMRSWQEALSEYLKELS